MAEPTNTTTSKKSLMSTARPVSRVGPRSAKTRKDAKPSAVQTARATMQTQRPTRPTPPKSTPCSRRPVRPAVRSAAPRRSQQEPNQRRGDEGVEEPVEGVEDADNQDGSRRPTDRCCRIAHVALLLPQQGGVIGPAWLYNASMVASMGQQAHLPSGCFWGELPRIHLPRTPVNRAKKKGRDRCMLRPFCYDISQVAGCHHLLLCSELTTPALRDTIRCPSP